MNTVRHQVSSLLKKVVLQTVTLEEGAFFLNDLEKHSRSKEELCNEFCDICRSLPQETHAKTFLRIIALTKNPVFEKALIAGLEHPDESAVTVSLEGMAGYKHDAAKTALLKQLAHPLPHVAKAAGEMIVKRWGIEGIKIVIENGICNEHKTVINTACSVLSTYGVIAVPIVIDAMPSMNANSLLASAKLLVELKESIDIQDQIDRERMETLIQILERVAGNKDPNLIIAVLELLGAMKDRLAGYEDTIEAYLHVEHSTIKLVAHKVLSHMNTDRARTIVSSVKISLGMGGFIVEQMPAAKDPGR